MPDLLPGTTITDLDTPPTVADTQVGLFSFDSTVFGVDADTGAYSDCGVSFLACTTGRAKIDFAASLDNSGAASTTIAPVVRTGSTVGAGTEVISASLDNSLINIGSDERRYGASLLVESLTPGDTYNVRLEHRVSGGTGTIQRRHIIVAPAT